MRKRAVLVAGLIAGMMTAMFSAEPAPPAGPAPDQLPTHLIKVLRTSNKAQTNRYVCKVYTVNNVNPYNIYRWVKRTAQIEEGAYYVFGRPEVEGDYDSVKSGKIVVVVPEYMIPGIDQLMAVVDRPDLTSSQGEEVFYFRPTHRHVNDPGFVDLINAIRGTSGTVAMDVEANCVLFYAAASKVQDLRNQLLVIDQPPPQVMVEVTVYELFVDNSSRLGLDYVSWKNGPGRNLFVLQGFREYEKVADLHNAAPLIDPGTAGTYGLPGHEFSASGRNAVYFVDVPSAFFDYLTVKNKARVMTASKLCTRNLVAAGLQAGDTILYYRTQVGGAANAGIRPTGVPADPNATNAAFPDNRTVVGTQQERVLAAQTAGVELRITPTIGTEMVDMNLTVGLVSHTGFDDKGVPQLVSRRVQQVVRARDGEEIILGGYSREVVVERSDKMPILGSLPLLGYLFGGQSTVTQRRQVVIVLTPHIIKDFNAFESSGFTIDAAQIRSKALGEKVAPVPNNPAGFDQWLLDSGK